MNHISDIEQIREKVKDGIISTKEMNFKGSEDISAIHLVNIYTYKQNFSISWENWEIIKEEI